MPESSEQLLARLAGWPGVNRYLVAFSGGLDSTVLLHAMAAYARERRGLQVRALHIHHGLHPDADRWAAHCRRVGAAVGLPVDVYRAVIRQARGESPEAAARHARYRLFAHAMQANDALLTAHHSDDQLETLLMRLARGAGVEGLAGIPACRSLGPGQLLRPFLAKPRAALVDYAEAHRLESLEDPSNTDNRYDRNYLRNEIVPRLKARWPAAAASAVRSAGHLAAASRLMEQLARADLRRMRDAQGALPVAPLRRLGGERLHNLLRYWISDGGYCMPSTARLEAVVQDVIAAARDAEPYVAWQGAEIRRYRDQLFIMPPLPQLADGWRASWDPREALALPPGLGRLTMVAAEDGGIDVTRLAKASVTVQFREGGERIQPAGSVHHRTLRNLYQERGIVPWMRARIPLIYSDDRLAAVANLWIAEEFRAATGRPAMRLDWEGHPCLSA